MLTEAGLNRLAELTDEDETILALWFVARAYDTENAFGDLQDGFANLLCEQTLAGGSIDTDLQCRVGTLQEVMLMRIKANFGAAQAEHIRIRL